MFEKRDSVLQASMGGGVQLSGGAKVLEALGQLPALHAAAERFTGVLSRNSLAEVLLDLDVDALVRERAPDVLCADSDGTPVTYSIMRDALQGLLVQAACAREGGAGPRVTITTGKQCTQVLQDTAENPTVGLVFADGSMVTGFDLVVGADGISSAVRDFTASQNAPLLPIPLLEPGNRYTGVRITFATTDADPEFVLRPKQDRGKFHQWFGDGCYALCASYGGSEGVQHMLSLVRGAKDDDAVYGENAEWTEDSTDLKATTKERLLKAGFKGNADLMTLLDGCNAERFVDISVRDRSLPLKGWSSQSGRVVLLGDSAHAMAPFLGQGANQAIEDAYALAFHVNRYNSPAGMRALAGGSLKPFVDAYELERKLPTGILSVKSNFLGLVETLGGPMGQLVRDLFFKTMGRLGVAAYIFLDGATPKVDLRDYRDK